MKTGKQILFLVSFLVFCSPAAWPKDKPSDAISKKIETIYSDYQRIVHEAKEGRAEQLVELDKELRLLVEKPFNQSGLGVSMNYWDKKYVPIGLVWTGGQNQDFLIYSGKLLLDAKAADRNNRFREYTMYTEIVDPLNDQAIPNFSATKDYESKYPSGPFISEVFELLAKFYSDHFRDISIDVRFSGCLEEFKPKLPKAKRLAEARRLALEYFGKALKKIPPEEHHRIEYLKKLQIKVETGKRWTESHFCSDE